jgi:hypothetical protein
LKIEQVSSKVKDIITMHPKEIVAALGIIMIDLLSHLLYIDFDLSTILHEVILHKAKPGPGILPRAHY